MAKPHPTFSIITPVFNAGPYLVRAVQSALRQSYSDFELILIDDGSTDNAIDEVAKLADPRMRILRQANQGAPSACNAGLEAARGTYLAFLDHDDLWAPAKLSRHLDSFGAHPDVDLTFTWTSYIGEGDQDLGLPLRRWRGRITFEQLLLDNVIGASSSVAVRRSIIEKTGGFDTHLPLTYDLDFYLRVLRLCQANALAIPEVLTFYRRHSVQMSKDWRVLRKDWRALMEKFRSLAPKETARLELRANLNMTRYFAFLAYERREFDSGCTLLAEGFRMSPSSFVTDRRNWKLGAACLAGRLLPARIHRRLEAQAGIRTFSDRKA
jgi:glycosyltransferase involved in cell wall biosynthesis